MIDTSNIAMILKLLHIITVNQKVFDICENLLFPTNVNKIPTSYWQTHIQKAYTKYEIKQQNICKEQFLLLILVRNLTK